MATLTATQLARARNALAWIRKSDKTEDRRDHTDAALAVLAEVWGTWDMVQRAIARGLDPDPRLNEDTTWGSLEEALLGLDERERWLAVRHAHRMRAQAASIWAEAPWQEPAMWGAARDRAIVEACEERAQEEARHGAR